VITAIDTNVLLDVLIPDARFAEGSQQRLDEAARAGGLVIGEIVYAELGAAFDSRTDLDRFLAHTRIRLDPCAADGLILAAQAWRAYGERRDRALHCPRCGARQSLTCADCGEQLSCRQHILSDFLVGGHALAQTDGLLTRDRGYYQTYFPSLRLVDA
jgi:predicted nucleic acid-binding protein